MGAPPYPQSPSPRPHARRVQLLAAALVLAACAPYPRDPGRTTERVEGGVLRVGAIHDPPFVQLREGRAPAGREPQMVHALARSLDARVQWVAGGSDALLGELERSRLDLVIGGLAPRSPWRRRVGLTLPYAAADAHGRPRTRVAAVPPGENRWQMRVERFQRTPQARAILRGGPPAPAPAR